MRPPQRLHLRCVQLVDDSWYSPLLGIQPLSFLCPSMLATGLVVTPAALLLLLVVMLCVPASISCADDPRQPSWCVSVTIPTWNSTDSVGLLMLGSDLSISVWLSIWKAGLPGWMRSASVACGVCDRSRQSATSNPISVIASHAASKSTSLEFFVLKTVLSPRLRLGQVSSQIQNHTSDQPYVRRLTESCDWEQLNRVSTLFA